MNLNEQLFVRGFRPDENDIPEIILGRDHSWLHIKAMETDDGYWIICEDGSKGINLGHFIEIEPLDEIIKALKKGT